MTEAKSPREIAREEAVRTAERLVTHSGGSVAPCTGCVDIIESALLSYAAEREAEVKRLTGVLGHVREHLLRDEEFDADELDRDIKGSVDLNEFDRFQQRAEKAESYAAERERRITELEGQLHAERSARGVMNAMRTAELLSSRPR